MAVANKVAVGSSVSADKYNWLDVAASRFVARLASGDVKACTVAEILTLLSVYTQAQVDALVEGLAHKEMVIDYIVDNTAAPPTEVSGDRYILSHDGGAPHANWDGASAGDIVEFGGSTWAHTTPLEGWTCLADTVNREYTFSDTVWVKRASLSAHNDCNSIQGGTTAQYYHLTLAQHTQLAFVGGLTAAANSLVIYTAADAAAMTAIGEAQMVGRKTGGTLGPLTAAEVIALLALDSRYVLPVGAADIEITDAAKGLILRDTQGTPHKWRVTIDNSGNLVTADLGAA